MLEGREGGCACGAVRYRMEGTPMFVHCCHCTSCQTETGTPFALNALIEADRVKLLKANLKWCRRPVQAARGRKYGAAPDCRVAVWSTYGGAGDAIRFVRVGTLDGAASVPPDIHIYTRSKLPWVQLSEGAQAVEAHYNARECWPPESQARFRAVRG